MLRTVNRINQNRRPWRTVQTRPGDQGPGERRTGVGLTMPSDFNYDWAESDHAEVLAADAATDPSWLVRRLRML